MPTCKNCQNDFIIYPEDRAFYIRMKVPPPDECPSCREQRRLSWRNERTLYTRVCDLCHRPIVSIYHQTVPFPVYCAACWWSDQWDPFSFGREYDSSRGFFEQFTALLHVVPQIAVANQNSENSEYCNEVEGLKDSYLAMTSFFGERLLYTYWLARSHDCVDCSFILHSDLCYECQDVYKCYNCRYVYNSDNIIDSTFCFNCTNCQNCLFCFNLVNKNYCINNKQYSPDEYQKKLQTYNFRSRAVVMDLQNKFWADSLAYPRRFAFIKNSSHCQGNYIKDSKNTFFAFDIFGHEDGRYLYDCGQSKDAVDCSQSGLDCELMYQMQSGTGLYNVAFGNFVWRGRDLQYSDHCYSSHDIFGCIGMQKSNYCILNKQYSAADYQRLVGQIIQDMTGRGEYGHFFPIEDSPFGYNETVAHQHFPMTKEEVVQRGWHWQDQLPGVRGQETVATVPDTIDNVSLDIVQEIMICQGCRKNYKIIEAEFQFYKKHGIPPPAHCPDCRHYQRLSLRNPRKLWHRQCMCEQSDHNHAGKCLVEFETTYAPDQPEKVYCEECYQKEIY
ncbi:hypothetical protein HY933_01360 [Candidatus Falkowbacteria bacterium]|nr:hypothetical protein [Candidatus Falkowbacteria bacterium]